MSVERMTDLDGFHRFITRQLAEKPTLSPEDALDLWRAGHPLAEHSAENLRAVREAIADMQGGDEGLSLDEFDQAFRQHHGLAQPE